MVVFENVSKIFAADIDLARTYALRDMLGVGRRRGELRPGEFYALREVSFQIADGEMLLLLGTPGAGKSTVTRLVCGLLAPDSGCVRVDGRAQLVGEGKLGANAFMTVDESLELALALVGVPPDRNAAVRADVLALCELEELAQARLADVPRDAQRVLFFAASLAGDADVYVFDGRFVVGEGPVRQRLLERVLAVMRSKSVLVTSTTVPELPVAPRHAIALHEGQPIFYGEARDVGRLYERFAEKLRRPAAHRARLERRAAAGVRPAGRLVAGAGQSVVAGTATAARLAEATRRTGVMSPLVVDECLARARASGRPVLVGPWLSNVAIELLYWVPFVTWVRSQLPPEHPVVVVSRGGADLWYAHAGPTYLDIYDLMPVEAFLEGNQRRVQQAGTQKQLFVSDFDREVLALAHARLGLREEDVVLLHPSLLYRLWSEIWRGRLPVSFAARYARYDHFVPQPEPDASVALPEGYVAVKFEFNAFFEASDRTRQLMADLVRALARRGPVVVLNTGHDVDNYREAWVEAEENVYHLPRVEPRRSLAVQTRVLACAQAFVGAYGGISLVAPFCSVDAVTVYTSPGGFFAAHRAVLATIMELLGGCSYEALEIGTFDPVRVADQVAGSRRPRCRARGPFDLKRVRLAR